MSEFDIDIDAPPSDPAASAGDSGPADDENVITFPSELVRPVPSFSITKPPDWLVAEIPSAVLTIGAPGLMDGVWVNASVVHERVAPSWTVMMAAKASWYNITTGSPDATINNEAAVMVGDREVYMRGADIPANDERPALGQLHAIFFGPERERPTFDLFQIICTGPQSHMAELAPMFVYIAASFRFT